jgi:hypothetical protein
MNNINSIEWHKITEAQSRGITEMKFNDTDGKPIHITITKTGWYEGYY